MTADIVQRRIAVFKAALAEVGYEGDARPCAEGPPHNVEVWSTGPAKFRYRAGILACMAAPVPGDSRCCFPCWEEGRHDDCGRVSNHEALRFVPCDRRPQ